MADLRVVNFGGGLQTCLIAELVANGTLPRPDVFVFADTGNEPQYVYEQVNHYKELIESVGIPFLIVSNGNMENDLYSGKRFAAMPLFTVRKKRIGKTKNGEMVHDQLRGKLKRQCTNEYKIVPIDRAVKSILLEQGLAVRMNGIRIKKDVLVETWIGFTVDEIERVRPSRNRWQKMVYPLLNLRLYRSDCEQWYVERGLPVPKSSACIYCPLISIARQRELKTNEPTSFAKRVQFDHDLRNGQLRISATAKGELYLSDKFIPVDQIDLAENNSQPSLFLYEHGHCIT